MTKNLQIFYSNRVERLYLQLKESLFAQSDSYFTKSYLTQSDSNRFNPTQSYPIPSPFTRRLIIVPSPAMKGWLMQRLANDLGIAAGIEISYLDPSINSLQKKQRPSVLVLALKLELAIRRVVTEYSSLDSEEQELWRPIVDYVTDGKGITKKAERRLIVLADKLAYLFMQYEKFGELMLTEWLTMKSGGWQGALWREVIGEVIIPEIVEIKNTEIHLFAVSFISREQHQLFSQISDNNQGHQVNYYLLSPCQGFWSDIVSDREGRRQTRFWREKGASEGQIIELEDYLYKRNPLLANFGRLGREMTRLIEETDVEVFEDYALPSDVSFNFSQKITQVNHPSLLHEIQGDLLILRDLDPKAPIELPESDRSVEVHVASSRMREIEILHDNILRMIKLGVPQEEIIVMAPDIMDYEPYIRAVFHGGPGQIDCQIMDLHMLSQNANIQAFMHLLSLPLGRWDAMSLIELFEFAPFQKKQRWENEDVQRIRRWIKTAGVRWGIDKEHRIQILKGQHGERRLVDESPVGTWEHGLSRLLLGMAMVIPSDDENCFASDKVKDPSSSGLSDFLEHSEFNGQSEFAGFPLLPLGSLEMTESVLLGDTIMLLRNLHKDLGPIVNAERKTIGEWINYLRGIVETYLGLSDDLLLLLETFQHLPEVKDELFLFITIKYQLERLVSKERVSYRESHLHAVRFCSMLPMRAIPARVVALLGMNEGAYPRTDGHFSLNQMAGNPKADYSPSQTDFDRYLFLETLLSARQYFLLSYVGYSTSDGKEQPPSLLISELMSYLDRGYRVEGALPSEKCVIHHPFRAYDKKYFSNNQILQSYSITHYQEAVAFYEKMKQKRHSFVGSFAISEDRARKEGKTERDEELQQSNLIEQPNLMEQSNLVEQPNKELKQSNVTQIELRRLVQMARNPIAAYFNQTLGIYLEKDEDRLVKTKEDFLIDALENAMLRKRAVIKSFDKVVSFAEKDGRLPIGPFKGVVVDRLKSEVAEYRENLRVLGVDSENLFTLELLAHVDDFGEGRFPPLRCEVNGRIYEIVGRLPEVCDQGLVAFVKDDKVDAIKIWPEYLVMCALIEKYGLQIEPQLLMIKTGKARGLFGSGSVVNGSGIRVDDLGVDVNALGSEVNGLVVRDGEINDSEPLKMLARYIAYYEQGLMTISPLLPEWVPAIIEGDPEKFRKKMKESLSERSLHFYNSYMEWLARGSDIPDSELIISYWKGVAENVYGGMLEEWYPNHRVVGKKN